MSIDRLPGVLARGRAMAEARMRGTSRITRVAKDADGQPIQVTDSDGNVTQERETIYEGKSRAHYTGTPWPSTPDVSGTEVTIRPIFLSIPSSTPARIEVGDLVEILTDIDTPSLAGDVYRVIEPGNASQETAQRILCQHYVSGVDR